MNAIALSPSERAPASSNASAAPLGQAHPETSKRNIWGGIAVPPGHVSPLGFMPEWREEAGLGDGSIWIACGLAAAAWGVVENVATVMGRDAILALVEDACPIADDNLVEAFGLEDHELDPSRDRVAVRLATDPEFTQRFHAARVIMNVGCAYFPWYKGDGRIPN